MDKIVVMIKIQGPSEECATTHECKASASMKLHCGLDKKAMNEIAKLHGKDASLFMQANLKDQLSTLLRSEASALVSKLVDNYVEDHCEDVEVESIKVL